MTVHHAASNAHREIVLEQHLVSQLVEGQGYLERSPEEYDRPLALDKALVLRFVRETQPDEWLKLEAQYATSAEAEFLKQLEKALGSVARSMCCARASR
jgi:type I restriction enzyme R subunit